MNTPSVGDSIFIRRSGGGWGRLHFKKAIVERVSPQGSVTVKWPSGITSRFLPNGKEVGGLKYLCDCLDEMPFAEREAYLAMEQRLDKAVAAVAAVQAPDRPSNSKETLQQLVTDLQAKLDAAKALVEAI